MSQRLSLCMIAKDEADNLPTCLESVRAFVDEIIVCDTGSSDDTRAVAARLGARVVVFDQRTNPEAFYVDDEATCKPLGAPEPYSGDLALGNFGAARAESFKHATGDFVVWLDCDDVLEQAQALRAVVAEMDARKLDVAFLPYDYARDANGRVFYRQWRERIVRRGSCNWVNPVHEVLLPARPIASARFEQPTVSHRRKADRKSIPHRNYKILLRQLYQQLGADGVNAILKPDGAPDARIDPRQLFYLGQEARFVDAPRAALFYEAYLRGSGWGEERAAAHVALGHFYEFGMLPGLTPQEAYSRADREYATAAAEMPDNPDGLFGMARIAYLRERFHDCVSFSERGFRIGNTESMLGANPLDRTYRPHVYFNHALAKLGRVEEAIASCKAGLAACPDDPGVPGGAQGMLQHNLAVYEKELQARKAANVQPSRGQPLVELDKNEDLETPPADVPRDALVIWALQLWKQNVAAGEVARTYAFLGSLPPALYDDPVITRMMASTVKRFPVARGDLPKMFESLAQVPRQKPIEKLTSDMGALAEAMKREDLPQAAVRIPDGMRKLAEGLPLEPVLRPGALSIVFWIGPAIEPWDPTTPEKQGIGGSETACIELARNMAQLGHAVTVYGHCPGRDGVYDGVVYKHWESMRNGSIECDVLISSRQPQIMESRDRLRYRLAILWVHDIHVGPSSPQMERWLQAFDRVWCLSQWHREFFCKSYPYLDPARVEVTRNGIDPNRFLPQTPLAELRKTNRLVWSSSPNRGLDYLLHNFRFIQREVPDVRLDIFYGFDCWEAFARMRQAQDELAAIAEFKRRIDQAVKQGGVYFHGRQPQHQVAEAYLRAKVWGYLTQFTETSCVTAMEAMAAGAVPVCSALAALPETVKHGVFIKNESPHAPQIFIEEVVDLLKNDQRRIVLAEAAREHALRHLRWDSLAEYWALRFKELIAAVEANPLPRWKSA